MKAKILTITMMPLSVVLSMAVGFLLLGQAMVGGIPGNPCPDTAAATDQWHSACPGSEGASGCTDTYYTDSSGNVLSTVCGTFVGQRCCLKGFYGPVTQYVGDYLCTLWGDTCNTNLCIFTTPTYLSGVNVYQSYDCSHYTNCPPPLN